MSFRDTRSSTKFQVNRVGFLNCVDRDQLTLLTTSSWPASKGRVPIRQKCSVRLGKVTIKLLSTRIYKCNLTSQTNMSII